MLRLVPSGPETTKEIEVAVGVTDNEKVVLDFREDVSWLDLSPDQAREVALLLQRAADEIEKRGSCV